MKVALLADIHANSDAFSAVYDDLEKLGVEQILVVGDLVGYYYAPRTIVERLREDRRVICIRGNHEDILTSCRTDPSAAQQYQRKYGSGYQKCVETLDLEMLDWLEHLPVSRKIEFDGVSFYMCHGGLEDTDRYIYPDADVSELARNYSRCTFTVFGHTHYPFMHHLDGRVMVNPGSVGQPRDRGGLASYAVVDTHSLTVQPRRVPFDIAPLVAAAQRFDPHIPYLWKIHER
jgi:putative phosphoesterase